MVRAPLELLFVVAVYIWIAKPAFINNIIPYFFGNGTIVSFLIVLVLVWGINFLVWGFIGFVRFTEEKIKKLFSRKLSRNDLFGNTITKDEVAIIVPAHNEELVIDETLLSLLKLTKHYNIFVVSDGSKDKTGDIARSYEVNVLELNPSHGKAGALETCIKHFNIEEKYKAVVLVDADTRLKIDYLDRALPFFNDPEIVAVAGYASTIWTPEKFSLVQKLFVSHRERVYFLFQTFVKFGQTWKYTNVASIIPGFASMYRTSILKYIDMNPKGLVIEDFNMTFEVHHKKLGKIAHDPSIVGYTQDPDNLNDYFKQIKRWHLGFWQTIRHHGFWTSKFWAAMSVTLMEVISGSLVFIITPFLIIASFFPPAFVHMSAWPVFMNSTHLLVSFIIGVWLSDYLLTLIVAVAQNRFEYVYTGIFFPFVRFFDAIAFLSAIPRAYVVKSNGKWVSPSRRAE